MPSQPDALTAILAAIFVVPSPQSRANTSLRSPSRNGLRSLLRAIDGYQGTLTVRCALRLAPLVFVRPGELRKAEWADIDLDAAEWRYTVSKTDTAHIVPLSTQAVSNPARDSTR